jgi:rubrerythrin
MSREPDYTPLEVFGIAIKSEIEAVTLYRKMKEMTKNPDLETKLDFLISQEKRHQAILTDAYNKRFSDVELKLPPKSLVPIISDVLSRDASLKELFEAGMEAETLSEKFYKELAGKTVDSNSKSLLLYLASMEQSHRAILEAEYNQLEMGEDYNSDDYLRGERLMNLGP